MCRILSRVLSSLLGRIWSSARGRVRLLRVRLGPIVGLLELGVLRSSVVLSDDSVVVHGTTTLDTEDDEEDPSDELADATDSETGHTTVEFAIVTRARVVVVVVVAAAVVVGQAAGCARRVCSNQGTADDEHDNCSDEEADGPPFGKPGGLLRGRIGVHRHLRHGEEDEMEVRGEARKKKKVYERAKADVVFKWK